MSEKNAKLQARNLKVVCIFSVYNKKIYVERDISEVLKDN